MRQVEIIEEKTKEISRIKANEPAVMGRNQSEFEQLTAKCRAGTNELEKQVQLSLGLKSENQALRSELQSISNKLARKNQKMLAMEQQIKSESEGRVKRLQKEVYQLQQANEELQARLEQKSLTSKSLRNSPT